MLGGEALIEGEDFGDAELVHHVHLDAVDVGEAVIDEPLVAGEAGLDLVERSGRHDREAVAAGDPAGERRSVATDGERSPGGAGQDLGDDAVGDEVLVSGLRCKEPARTNAMAVFGPDERDQEGGVDEGASDLNFRVSRLGLP